MNLLVVNYEYPPLGGGAANASWNIAKSIAEIGHDVTVLTSAYKNRRGWEHENGVSIYRCVALRRAVEKSDMIEMASFLVSSLCHVPFIAGEKKFHGAIVFFSFPCGPVGLFGKAAFNIPYVVSLRGGDVPGAEPGLRRLHSLLKIPRRIILKNALAVVCPSEGLKKMALEADPVPIEIIPNGVDFQFFKASKKKTKSDDGTFKFLFVGRFQPQKNISFMLEQFGRLKRKYGVSFTLEIVGDGPQKDEMVAFCKKSGISDRTRWHGWVEKDKLLKIYQSSDCMVNFSLYEGMSNASLEAIACELPLIASNVPGNRELVVNGKTGFIVDFDPDEISLALLCLAENPNFAKNMGKRGRMNIMELFNWKDIGLRYLDIFIRKMVVGDEIFF